MLFHSFNIDIYGIMTKSKQNPLVLLPQGTPKASAPGQRKELAAGKLFWQNSVWFWKLQGMGLPSLSCRCLAWQMISESRVPFLSPRNIGRDYVWQSTWGGAEGARLYWDAKAKYEQHPWVKAWDCLGKSAWSKLRREVKLLKLF